jgi:hypothetical protein
MNFLRIATAVSMAFGLMAWPAVAADSPAPAPAAKGVPSWILSPVGVGKSAEGATSKTAAQKGLAIQLGEHGEAAVAYDLELCRLLGGWTGQFATPADLLSHAPNPTALGDVAFTTGQIAGVITGDAKEPWHDDRPTPAGPLPPGQAQFVGFYPNGARTILKWRIGGIEVLEMPSYDVVLNGGGYFTRTFQVPPSMRPIQLLVAGDLQPDGPIDVLTHLKSDAVVPGLEDKERIMQSTPWVHGEHGEVMIWAAGDPDGSTWRLINGQLALEIPQHAKPTTFQIAYWTAPKNDPDGKTAPLFFHEPDIDLQALIRDVPMQQPEAK